MILETIVASLLPVGIDGIKQVITRVAGGPQPTNVDEVIKLDQANVERLKAVAALDNPYGNPSQWVVNLRSSFRYIASAIIILCAMACLFISGIPDALRQTGLELGGVAFSFIFGDRVYLGLKGSK